MATIRISEAEAARDFAGLMARVRAGAEVVIDDGTIPVAILHPAAPSRRSITECIALAARHEEETGEAPVIDAEFAADVEEIISQRKPSISIPPRRPGRLLSECIALAEARGSTVTLDEGFATDLLAVIESHSDPVNPPAWN